MASTKKLEKKIEIDRHVMLLNYWYLISKAKSLKNCIHTYAPCIIKILTRGSQGPDYQSLCKQNIVAVRDVS
jgi:hypothetical protein